MNILQPSQFQDGQRKVTANEFTIYEVEIAKIAFFEITFNKYTVAEFVINELFVDVIDLLKRLSVMKFNTHVAIGWNQI
jgi:hypothetical protein